MQDCYITATLSTHKDRASEVPGPCGPCSWINLLKLNGSFELEKELADSGRLKPLHASSFISYLVWAENYGVDVEVYASSFEITKGMFEMMFSFEEIPLKKQAAIQEEILDLVAQVVARNSSHLHILKGHPITLIDSFVSKGYRVLFNMADVFDGYDGVLGHVQVCVGFENGRYLIADSNLGLLHKTRDELVAQIDNLDIVQGIKELVIVKNRITTENKK